MDVSLITDQLYGALWYLIPMVMVITVMQSPWFKGLVGEFIVNLTIRLRLPKPAYHLIKNVTLPTDVGTTQIDHIIVSRYGIFVVETKNMKGWIFGSPNQKQWTQQIFKHKNRFQNPLHQNFKHTKTLQDLLNLGSGTVFSVVVFTGESTFKTPMPDNVTHAGGCISFVKARQDVLLSDEQVTDIIDRIESGRLDRGFKTNRDHVAHVRQVVKQKANTKRCSKCGSVMVMRQAKKGKFAGNKFWGCSSFPQCRNIENMN